MENALKDGGGYLGTVKWTCKGGDYDNMHFILTRVFGIGHQVIE
jgi:hypothetical protein